MSIRYTKSERGAVWQFVSARKVQAPVYAVQYYTKTCGYGAAEACGGFPASQCPQSLRPRPEFGRRDWSGLPTGYVLHALAGDPISVTACHQKAHLAVKKCRVESVNQGGGKLTAVKINLQHDCPGRARYLPAQLVPRRILQIFRSNYQPYLHPSIPWHC